MYARTGGPILQWPLKHNFSAAVWVGHITLIGIAVETGVVVAVYLREALDPGRSPYFVLDEEYIVYRSLRSLFIWVRGWSSAAFIRRPLEKVVKIDAGRWRS